MLPPNQNDLLQRTYELARDNNKMLRSMRRGAFIGGIIKLIVWAAFIILPFWLYLQYLAPTLNQAINSLNQAQSSMQQIQDAGAKITVPAGDLAGMWESLRAYLPNNGEQ